MKILFLTRHENKGASSRYRSIQFFPYFEAAGHEPIHKPLFTDAYLDQRAAGRKPFWTILRLYLARFAGLLPAVARADVVVIEKELFPMLPAWTERLAKRRGVPVIYDYDDATWHAYERLMIKPFGAIFRHKIRAVAARADHVVAGSQYLKDQLSIWTNAQITDLPTCVPAVRYTGQGQLAEKNVEIVWVGSMSTGQYLLPLFPLFEQLHVEMGARVRAIGFSPNLLNGPTPAWLDVQAWSTETEIPLMASGKIGIMPIPDTPFERGKCGFKLVQYMGLGLPTVASPVGENKIIVQDGVTGLLADSLDDWHRALTELLLDPSMREEMGARGRELFLARYCTEKVAKKWIALIEDLMPDNRV